MLEEPKMGRMMGVVLVGQLDGRRHVRWGVALLLSCVLGIFCAAVAVAFYYLLSGGFSMLVAWIGFGGPFITVGTGIRMARQSPIEQLTPLGKSAA